MRNLDTQPHAQLQPSLWAGRLALGRWMLTISLGHSFEREQPARLGNRLAVLRREQGWSRQELADMLSIHPATLAELENGSYLPSLHLAFRLSELFQLPVDTLFFSTLDQPGHIQMSQKESIDAKA